MNEPVQTVENRRCNRKGILEMMKMADVLKTGKENVETVEAGKETIVAVDMGFMGYKKPVLVKNMTSRLKQLIDFARANGPANSWAAIAALGITEDEFGGSHSKAGWRKDPHLMIDNGGVISVMALTKLIDHDSDFGWGHRPRLVAAYPDLTGAPTWLLEMYDAHWKEWAHAMAQDEDMQENARPTAKCGPHCD